MKKILNLSITFFLLLVLVLGGCSNSSSQSSGKNNKVTITMWNRYPELNDPLANFIKGFEKEHKDIHVKLTNIPPSSQNEQYQTAVKENDLPDIFTTSAPSLQELLKLDKVHKLDGLFPNKVKKQYVAGTWVEGKTEMNGHTYVLPLYSPNHGNLMMYYNKDVLKKYGIDENNLPTTWNELLKVGKKIYKKSHGATYGLIGSKDPWGYGDNIVNQMATAISPRTPTTINYKTGRPSLNTKGDLETIKFYKKMLDEHVLSPQTIEIDEAKSVALFSAGKSAFLFQGDWEGANIVSKGFKNWGVTKLPTKNGKPHYSEAGGGDGLEVSKNTKHWPEVKTFLKYALNHIYSKAIVEPVTSLPAKKDVKATPAFPQFKQIIKVANESAIPVPDPSARNSAAITFMQDYYGGLKQDNVGDAALGYLSGQVKNIDSELDKLNKKANDHFDNMLKKHTDVKPEYFKFPNWTPFTPYTQRDYKELKRKDK